jgi:hypothetical protein
MGDQALYGLGDTLERLKTPKEAIPYYSRLVRDFPLSPRVDAAKERLVAMGQAVPKPTKATMARAQADRARLRPKSLLGKLGTAMAATPDTSATLRGPVEIGGAPASGVVLAKQAPAAPSIPTASMIVQPAGDPDLSSGKAVESKPATDPSSPGTSAGAQDNSSNPPASESSPKAQENKVSASSNQSSAKAGEGNSEPTPQGQSGTDTPQKKKGRFHLLKKVIKPI